MTFARSALLASPERAADAAPMSPLSAGEPWDVIVSTRIPVLVVGLTDVTAAFMQQLKAQLPIPLIDIDCDRPWSLNELETYKTIVLHDIDRLPVSDQRQVVEWLQMTAGRSLVITTSSHSLMPFVATGTFLETLYYRLNAVYVDLSDVRH